MDPFTQRMLERARARQEKIDQKLVNSGQVVPKRRPLTENIKTDNSPVKSPMKTSRDTILSPKKSIKETVNSPKRRSSQKSELAVASPLKNRNDFTITKKEFISPRGSKGRRNSDVSVEINILHREDIQIEVQVEEREAPIDVYHKPEDADGVIINNVTDNKPAKPIMDSESRAGGERLDLKSRLNRIGKLYTDSPTLSSPISRTEEKFSSCTPPAPKPPGSCRLGRLAALAQEMNCWEDDYTKHTQQPKPKELKKQDKVEDASTLDVSIYSMRDINKVLQTNTKSNQTPKPVNTRTFTKPAPSDGQKLDKKIVAELWNSDSAYLNFPQPTTGDPDDAEIMAERGKKSQKSPSDEDVPPPGDVLKAGTRIPPFWPEEPEIWFAQVEGQFAMSNVTSDLAKFNYVIGHLDNQHSREVKDIIVNPPADDKYGKLKAELIKRLSASKENKIKQLLTHEQLGDRKPSQFLRHLNGLAGAGVPEDFMKTMWISRLPHGVQTVLAGQSATTSVEDLADLADRVNDLTATSSPRVAAVDDSAPTPTSLLSSLTKEVAELRRQVQRLSSRRDGTSRSPALRGNRSPSRRRSESNYRKFPYCWYHAKFGAQARRCQKPCSYKEENTTGNQ